LDGVRGIAILLVVVWHYVGDPLRYESGAAAVVAARGLRLAGSGVDLFFVLSGFLIGGILLDHRESPSYFKTFYARRFCRIFPLYFAWLALFYGTLAAVPAFTSSPLMERMFQHPLPAWSYATFTQNLVMSWAETLGPDWLGITWSLAIEEQFYLLLPLVIRFIAAPRLPYLLGALALAAPVFRVLSEARSAYAAFVLMPCRADALLLGVLCAWAMRRDWGRRAVARGRRALYGVLAAMLVVLAALCAQPFRFERSPYLGSGLAVLYTVFLLLAVSERRGPVSWLVRRRWLRGLGILAYGVYLIHQAVNGLAHGVILGRLPAFGSLPAIAVTLAAAAVTLAMAALSWRKFEKPLVAWGQRVRYEPARLAGVSSPPPARSQEVNSWQTTRGFGARGEPRAASASSSSASSWPAPAATCSPSRSRSPAASGISGGTTPSG
jgi:peptidoglycan/LPS O-acetylase OafA/YrhL